MFSMNGRSGPLPLLSLSTHPCAGPIWALEFDARGEAACAFCTIRAARVGTPPRAVEEASVRERLAAELHRHRRREMGWVLLSPGADPFAPDAPDLAGPALAVAGELLRRNVGVVVRTRGGMNEARGLVPLARRHGDRLRVEPGFFSPDVRHLATWERGAAPLVSRYTLAEELRAAGAQVRARIGPIVPLVNDGEDGFRTLARELRRRGVGEVTPTWIEEGPGLLRQVEREVSASHARMLHGWFEMAPVRRGRRRRLAPRVRRHVLERLEHAATSAGLHVATCGCDGLGGAAGCPEAPDGVTRRRQLDLFAASA